MGETTNSAAEDTFTEMSIGGQSDFPGLAEMKAASEHARRLMEKDPKLPYVSALTIANDLASMERSVAWVESGEKPFWEAEPFVGSFGRFAFILWGIEHGHITAEEVYPDLAEHWRSADPDDTDPRALALFKAARAANGSVILDDPDRPLPAGRLISVYRGQDEGAPLGISWTTNIAVAEKFARGAATRQNNRGGIVMATKVPRDRVLAYITGRNEAEVILDPASIRADATNPRLYPQGNL